MRLTHQPETTSYGLALPPDETMLAHLAEKYKKSTFTQFSDRHHLYWPKSIYPEGTIAKKFREHRFNIVWLLRSDHNNIHRHYDGVPPPSPEIMHSFLNEAHVLDELEVCVKAIEMIDNITNREEKNINSSLLQKREEKLKYISSFLSKTLIFELVEEGIRQEIGKAAEYAMLAA